MRHALLLLLLSRDYQPLTHKELNPSIYIYREGIPLQQAASTKLIRTHQNSLKKQNPLLESKGFTIWRAQKESNLRPPGS